MKKQAENKSGKKTVLRSISVKILGVVLTAIILVAVACVAVLTVQNNKYSDDIIRGQVHRAFDYLNTRMDELKRNCDTATLSVANNGFLKAGVTMQDSGRIANALTGVSSSGLSFVIILDMDGKVLFSSNDKGGAAGTGYVDAALAGGAGAYADDANNLYLLSARPLNYEDGRQVGNVVGGIYYDQQEMLDELKEMMGVDFSVFSGDVRTSTTIMNNGERALGAKLTANLAQTVLKDKQRVEERTVLFGQPYMSLYAPLQDNSGNAIGVLFAGLQTAEIEQSRNMSMMISIGAAGILIVAAVVAMLIFVRRSIRKPLAVITKGALQLAAGNTDLDMNIRRGDEIGTLAGAFTSAADSLKAMLADANMLAQAAVDGELSTRADVEKHQGDFRKIVEGVNHTLDAVTEPVVESAAVLAEMAKGNLGVSVTGEYRGDHALIKEALNGTISTLKGYISEISSVLGEMAKGNLDVSIQSEYRGDFIALKGSINAIIESLNGVLGDISMAADQVASGTRQVSDGSQDISQGATEQSSAIEELTASIGQIAEQTRLNAVSAGEANTLTETAQSGAVQGNEQMKAMQQAMSEINEASRSISKIIKVIDDIAFQTNILALNAAVEAARAGVHGKGFAVVAEEVRNLAARSAKAAKETTELIESSIRKTDAGTKIADGTAAALGEIVEGIRKAGQLVSEIATASNEQATAITQVNRGIEQLSAVVQNNSATSEEAAAAAEELSGQAALLKDMVGQFSLKARESGAAPEISEVSETPETPALPARPERPKQKPDIDIGLTDSDFGKY